MSRPGFEPGPPAWEASTLEKSHLDSLSAGYSEPLLSRHLLTTFGPLQFSYFISLIIEGSGSVPLTNGSGSRTPKKHTVRIRNNDLTNPDAGRPKSYGSGTMISNTGGEVCFFFH